MSQNIRSKQVAIIDQSISEYQLLVNAAEAQGLDVILISDEGDGFVLLAEQLADRSNLEAIHLFSHGDDGQVFLGGEVLNSENLAQYRDVLETIDSSLAANGELLLYGCNIAETDIGLEFIGKLAKLTDSDVAASIDLTGSAEKGGDWILEVTTDDGLQFSYLDEELFASFSGVLLPTDGEVIDPEFFPSDFNDPSTRLSTDGFFELSVPALDEIQGANGTEYVHVLAQNADSSFTITAQGDLTSFELTGLNVAEDFPDNEWSSMSISGALLAGGTVTGTITDDANSLDHIVDLSNFANQQITSFTITFTSSNNNTDQFGFYDFTVTNANSGSGSQNTIPELLGTPVDQAVVEDITTAIDLSDYTVSDNDGDTITLTLAVDRGTVSTVDGDGTVAGVTIANSGTSTMTLQGLTDDLNTFLSDSSAVRYTTAQDDTTTATLSVTPFDGTDDGLTDSIDITVTPTNDIPVIANLTGDTVTFSDGDLNVSLDLNNDLTLTDADSPASFDSGYLLASITTNKNASQDQLSFSSSGEVSLAGNTSGSNVSVNGTVIGTLANDIAVGNDLRVDFNSDATVTRVQTLLQSLIYTNVSNIPSNEDRTVSISVYDDTGASSDTATVTVSVVSTNEAPVFTNVDGTPTFIEGGSAVVLDDNMSISDPELNELDSYSDASLTVQRSGGANADDIYGSSGTLSLLTEGAMFDVGNITIGEVTTNSAGRLVLTFNANATQALVDAALQQISYSNSSDLPDSDVQLSLSFNDGNSGSQGSGNNLTDSDDVINITITPVNDAPTIATNTGFTIAANNTTTITNAQLNEGDPDDDGIGLTYTLTSLPTLGSSLLLNGSALNLNDTFTQQDIDDDLLAFRAGNTGGQSTFNISLSDGGENGVSPVSDTLTVQVTPPPVTTPTTPTNNETTVVSNTNITPTTSTIIQNDNGSGNVVTVTLPPSVSITSEGPSTAQSGNDAVTTLVNAIDSRGSTGESNLLSGAQTFLSRLSSTTTLDIRTIVPTTTASSLDSPIVITGSSSINGGAQSEAFVIDLRSMSSGTNLKLDNIEFASIIGSATITGGAGSNYVTADDSSQFISLGEDDDELYGNGGDDIIGSGGGDDIVDGGSGDDTVFGGLEDDMLYAGEGNDHLNGGFGYDRAFFGGDRSDYVIAQGEQEGEVSITQLSSGDVNTLFDIETVSFDTGNSIIIAHNEIEAVGHYLINTWLDEEVSNAIGNFILSYSQSVDDLVQVFEAYALSEYGQDFSAVDVLEDFASSVDILLLDVERNQIADEEVVIEDGGAQIISGESGFNKVVINATQQFTWIDVQEDHIILTNSQTGTMAELNNIEMLEFNDDSQLVISSNQVESAIARLYELFFEEYISESMWQLGTIAAQEVNDGLLSADTVLEWFDETSGLSDLSLDGYINAFFNNVLDRDASNQESNYYQNLVTENNLDKHWIPVYLVLENDDFITTTGTIYETFDA
ncbi:DUF4347 domain-containing protein [Marinomonas ostreistagni]|uniref:DUF4347 domain-containing protein n=2 Tax=Marinomonas ostreistagni TaxID=359209 RepID=A0ABS0ZH42_9GAMM|nr:DUF4347 domain-containing protein [Marinomonas ostreistagni]